MSGAATGAPRRRRPARLAAALLAASVLGVRPARAHRLDEYLQAATFAVGRDRVALRLRLAPGVAVVPAVLAALDVDGDGVVTLAEQRAYAERVLGDLSLAVDGAPLRLRLVAVRVPALAAMRAGLGEIVLDLHADVPPRGGDRRLTFENRHQRGIGVYLVNSLVPSDPDVRITAQCRDSLQTSYRLDYAQAGAGPRSPDWWSPDWWSGVPGVLAVTALLPFAWRAAQPRGSGASPDARPGAPDGGPAC